MNIVTVIVGNAEETVEVPKKVTEVGRSVHSLGSGRMTECGVSVLLLPIGPSEDQEVAETNDIYANESTPSEETSED